MCRIVLRNKKHLRADIHLSFVCEAEILRDIGELPGCRIVDASKAPATLGL